MIKLTLPYPPGVNHYYRMVNNRMLLSKRGREYKEAVALVCARAAAPMLEGDLVMTVRLFRPQRSGDIDGRMKGIFDSLQGWIYKNDAQIVEMHVYRGDDRPNPRVEVEVETIGAVQKRLVTV